MAHMLSILSEIFMFLAPRITDLWALICTILNFIEYSQNNSAETLLDGKNNVAGQELITWEGVNNNLTT